MEFRVLGQLEIVDGDRSVRLGSHKQRSLFALLLIDQGSVLSTDHILDELWGDEAADRQNALWVHVSNLRSSLGGTRASLTWTVVSPQFSVETTNRPRENRRPKTDDPAVASTSEQSDIATHPSRMDEFA